MAAFALADRDSTLYAAVARELEERGWRQASAPADLLIEKRADVPWARLEPGITVNHVRGTKHVTLKALLARSIRDLCERNGASLDDSPCPRTFLIVPRTNVPTDETGAAAMPEDGRGELMDYERQRGCADLWICKATAGAHGTGIAIRRGAAEAIKHVDAAYVPQSEGALEGTEDKPWRARRGGRARPQAAWVVQRCIERPLLFGGRKFDIRAVALLTHDRRLFWCREFILRLCSEPHSLDDLDNHFALVSNHCVQERSGAYGAFEPGNERFREDLWRLLLQEFPGNPAAFDRVVGAMKAAVSATIEACGDHLDPRSDPFRSFQVLGYDFLIGDDLRVYLLEVNGSPAVAQRMKDNLADEIVNHLVLPATGSEADSGARAPAHDSATCWLEEL